MTSRDPVPIWIYAPIGRDGALLKGTLSSQGDRVHVARDVEDIRRASAEDRLGVLILTGEGLSAEAFGAISDHVARQPRWAELPVILLVDAPNNTTRTLERLQEALPRAKLLVLQRPVRPSVIDSAVEIMRLSRHEQYALRDYIERQEVLRRELNHRVKNILATVQAMYGLTVRATDTLEEFDGLFQGRLRAMSDVHDLLHVGSYTGTTLSQAIRSVLRPFAEEQVTLTDDAELQIGPEAAQSIALMMHELATNAAKYGALRGADGRVAIHARCEDGMVIVAWSEETALPIRAPERTGYGTTFVQVTTASFGGEATFDYAPGGLQITLRLPIGSIARKAS